MATLAEHTAARNDSDLFARFVAAAEQAGISNADFWVESNRGQLVSVDIEGTSSVSDVHAYAVATYNPTPAPGANPAMVTDAQIRAAIDAINPPAPTP